MLTRLMSCAAHGGRVDVSLVPATIAPVLLLSYGVRFGYSPVAWIGITAVLSLIAAAYAARQGDGARTRSR
jgi:uncharacterized membrane protein